MTQPLEYNMSLDGFAKNRSKDKVLVDKLIRFGLSRSIDPEFSSIDSSSPDQIKKIVQSAYRRFAKALVSKDSDEITAAAQNFFFSVFGHVESPPNSGIFLSPSSMKKTIATSYLEYASVEHMNSRAGRRLLQYLADAFGAKDVKPTGVLKPDSLVFDKLALFLNKVGDVSARQQSQYLFSKILPDSSVEKLEEVFDEMQLVVAGALRRFLVSSAASKE